MIDGLNGYKQDQSLQSALMANIAPTSYTKLSLCNVHQAGVSAAEQVAVEVNGLQWMAAVMVANGLDATFSSGHQHYACIMCNTYMCTVHVMCPTQLPLQF